MKKLIPVLALALVFVTRASSDSPVPSAEFTFARVQFNMDSSWLFFTGEAPWHHDYPFSDRFYSAMVREVTGIHTTADAYQIVELDSPEIFSFPFLYVSEPGFMDLTGEETQNLREYLNRGGFIMFDDFRGADLLNLMRQMKKVFPGRDMSRLDVSHPMFRAFYDIETLEMVPPYSMRNATSAGAIDAGLPEFWGMHDENDRLILIANHNNDFGEFWEWVDRGEMPFQPAAQAVRFGINYLVYAMTH